MRRVFLVLALLVAAVTPGIARVLNAADGRKIDAEVVGFDGPDKVRIKRTDTGQIFTLPIATFAEEDQKSLRAEAAEAAKPATLRDGDIAVELSRLRFDSRKSREDVPVQGGGIAKGLLSITDEDWGYSLTLKNNTHRTVDGLRAEYILYTKVDELKNTGRKPQIRQKTFSLKFDPLPAGERLSAKSQAVTTRKTELRGGVEWAGTGDSDTRDSLYGIWLRIYQGDALVLESASPTTIPATNKWTGAAD